MSIMSSWGGVGALEEAQLALVAPVGEIGQVLVAELAGVAVDLIVDAIEQAREVGAQRQAQAAAVADLDLPDHLLAQGVWIPELGGLDLEADRAELAYLAGFGVVVHGEPSVVSRQLCRSGSQHERGPGERLPGPS
jgi:hypothetical protein